MTGEEQEKEEKKRAYEKEKKREEERQMLFAQQGETLQRSNTMDIDLEGGSGDRAKKRVHDADAGAGKTAPLVFDYYLTQAFNKIIDNATIIDNANIIEPSIPSFHDIDDRIRA